MYTVQTSLHRVQEWQENDKWSECKVKSAKHILIGYKLIIVSCMLRKLIDFQVSGQSREVANNNKHLLVSSDR